jgi:hypothetical protein
MHENSSTSLKVRNDSFKIKARIVNIPAEMFVDAGTLRVGRTLL